MILWVSKKQCRDSLENVQEKASLQLQPSQNGGIVCKQGFISAQHSNDLQIDITPSVTNEVVRPKHRVNVSQFRNRTQIEIVLLR